MLSGLRLENVGPIPDVSLSFAPRMNLFTGDNGLGKTFLLDILWWSLTRKWPHEVNSALTSGFAARPTTTGIDAKIGFTVDGKSKAVSYESSYSPREESWIGKAGRPANPGLVIYAHADGGFSVWDPARNYWLQKNNIDTQERTPAFVFSPQNLWDGLTVNIGGQPTRVCSGLLADWSSWIKEKGSSAQHMEGLLCSLVPNGDCIEVAGTGRLSVNDVRDIPLIRPPYGGDVPILHASAGVRRAVGLAYVLVWSWTEHLKASALLGERATNRVILLFDEIESHLHPRWQRTILRSVLDSSNTLHENAEVQLFAATHSPLVLASAEPLFDAEKDAWFDFDLVDKVIELKKRTFVRRGDVSRWLTSDAFDLGEARSEEAEIAITKALAFLREPSLATKELVSEITQDLEASLSDIDRFWVRWAEFSEHLLSTGADAQA
jgi:AAA domain, putative AbiEii toxin, Type IV TA system